MRTLVLNAGYEPMLLVNWQRALCLVIAEKAEVVAQYDREVRTVSTSFALPSVVRLNRYIKVVRRFGIVRCTRRNIMLRDNFQCQYCGVQCTTASVSIDHIVPRSKGGRTVWDNVVAACHTCNRRKGDKSPEAKGMQLLRPAKRPHWRDIMGDTEQPMDPTWLPFISPAS